MGVTNGFRERAIKAYNEFLVLQAAIDAIETRTLAAYPNVDMAEYQLKNGEQFIEYRRLIANRDIKMRVASLNAAMAAMDQQSTVESGK